MIYTIGAKSRTSILRYAPLLFSGMSLLAVSLIIIFMRSNASGAPAIVDTTRAAIVQRPDGETNIAVKGPGNSLVFYFNARGKSEWGKLTIDGANTAYSQPAMIQRPDGETLIAVQGPNNSLVYYFNARGQSKWGKLTAAGANTTFSTPSIVLRPDGENNIAALGANNRLAFYYNSPGETKWHPFSPPNMNTSSHGELGNYSAPAIIQRPSGETDLIAMGTNNWLNYYFNAYGISGWGHLSPQGNTQIHGVPSAVLRPSGEVNVVATGQNNAMNMYANSPDFSDKQSWPRVATTTGGQSIHSNPHAVQRGNGETDIVAQGLSNSLQYFFNTVGQGNFNQLQIDGGGTAFSDPTLLQRADGESNVVVRGPNNSLYFYFNGAGQSEWGKLQVDGSNSAH